MHNLFVAWSAEPLWRTSTFLRASKTTDGSRDSKNTEGGSVVQAQLEQSGDVLSRALKTRQAHVPQLLLSE